MPPRGLGRLRSALGLLLACALGTASAQDMRAHADAAAAFDALRQADAGAMPRLAEPRAAALLRTLGDAKRFLPEPKRAGSTDALAALSDTCDRAREAAVAYQTFGALRGGQLDLRRMGDNAAEYQAELALLQPFLARCIARQIPLAESTLRQIDPRMRAQLRPGGLRRGQAAVMTLYASLATAMGDARISAANRQPLLAALAETAPVHARALSLPDRAALRRTLESQPTSGPAAAPWRRIRQAMGDTRCEALCELAAPAR